MLIKQKPRRAERGSVNNQHEGVYQLVISTTSVRKTERELYTGYILLLTINEVKI